jgi:galactokinase
MNPKDLAVEKFHQRFSDAPATVVRGPGRVNLIGEHTDYNLGYALPMAIDRGIWIALRTRDDGRVRLQSLDFAEPAYFSLAQIDHASGWADYAHGMAWTLQEAGYPLRGWEGVLASDLPAASGLSSSAALELALARAFWACSSWDWEPAAMAQTAQRMENEWLGLGSGIMDQLIAAVGRAGFAFLIDFRELLSEPVPIPSEVAIVVMDTRVPRGLVESAYNRRVAECKQAAAFFGVRTLRDVSLEGFQAAQEGLADPFRRRARHVISENARTLAAADRMRAGDVPGLGKLMTASHASLRDDYEVSCVELDRMVEIALETPGCHGARMTGAGFGGCAIALVDETGVRAFCEQVAARYAAQTGFEPQVFAVQPANGAEVYAMGAESP